VLATLEDEYKIDLKNIEKEVDDETSSTILGSRGGNRFDSHPSRFRTP